MNKLGLLFLGVVAFSSVFSSVSQAGLDLREFAVPPRGGGLERYSDRALLNELDRRGYSCDYDQPQPSMTLNMICNQFSELEIEIYDSTATKVAATKYFMSSSNFCQTERARILAETQAGRLDQPKTIAFCNPFTEMVKVRFSSNAIQETEKKHMGSGAACSSAADQFNSLF